MKCQVHYKGQLGRATALSATPEMERVKKNQENISSVKYTQDRKQMKGRPSLILDTPGLRHVKEAQNRISMVGCDRTLLLTVKIHCGMASPSVLAATAHH